jgi:5'-3' exonuclease
MGFTVSWLSAVIHSLSYKERRLQPLYLIDSSIYIFRAYFAMPERWQSPEGYSVDALYGFALFLFKFLDTVQPLKISAAFDESLGRCFRNEIFPDYKHSRAHPDEALAFQLSACKSLTAIMGVQALASERYEADDIIGSHAALARQRGENVCVVSRDKDLGQILKNSGDIFWDYAADRKVATADFKDFFGVHAYQVADYLALVGDSIDDIPGVPGIGKKTASALLSQFDSIEGLFADLDGVATCGLRGAAGLPEKLLAFQSQLAVTRQLTELACELELPASEQDLLWRQPSRLELASFFEAFGLDQALATSLQRYDWLVD